jgi:hypothetical protein
MVCSFKLKYLCLCLLTVPSLLMSVVKELPDVVIGSDFSAKAPLIKKELLPRMYADSDSLQPENPVVCSLRHKAPMAATYKVSPLALRVGTDTSSRTYLKASYHPDRYFDIVSFATDLSVPGAGRSGTKMRLSAGMQRFTIGVLDLSLAFQKSVADSFTRSGTSAMAGHYFRSFVSGDLTLQDIRTRLSFSLMKQTLANSTSPVRSIELTNTHELDWQGLHARNSVFIGNSGLGISSGVRIPWLKEYLHSCDLGLMTDFVHILPYLDLHSRWLLPNLMLIDLNNSPGLHNVDSELLAANHPWSALSVRNKLTLTPLDTSFSINKTFQSGNIIHRAAFKQNLLYDYNLPLLTSDPWGRQTSVSYGDRFLASSEFCADLTISAWKIDQSISLNLEYLPGSAWKRRPFSPLVRLKTEASTQIREVELCGCLNQEYWQRDEQNKAQKPVFNLGISAKYRINQDLKLVAGLENLFNTPYHDFGNLPTRGRSIFFALDYTPVR